MVAIVCSAIIAVGVGIVLYNSEAYIYGSDYYAQLYKLNVIEKSMSQGEFLPLYVREWYNGYEIYRYTPPASYLLTAVLSALAGGDAHKGISVFYGMMTFLSQLGFFKFGIRNRKMTAACLTGLTFLFLPQAFLTAISECSLDMVMGFALMPMVLFYLYDFVRQKCRLALFPFTVWYLFLILSNYVLAIAFGVVLFVFLIFSMLFTKVWKFEVAAMGNILLIYMIAGYFLYPALSGGILSGGHLLEESSMIPVSISLLAISVLGLVTTDRKRAAGFLIALSFMIFCFPVMESVMRLIPSKILQRPYWYIFPAVVIFLITLLTWERLRLIVLVIMLGFVIGENVPTLLTFHEGLQYRNELAYQEEKTAEDYLLEEAAACTDSRVALIDIARLGAFPQWYFASRGIAMMTGWDYENAPTVQNQIGINEAFADGFYDYMFDRLLLYGNDTVIVLKELLEEGADHTLAVAAENSGYEIAADNEYAVLFKATEIDGSYGVISRYENLAIGDSSAYIAYVYPSFELGRSNCLEDYSIEELMKYRKLYLSGFTYRNKEKAENMLRELSAKGIEIYINMQDIPLNALTGKSEFMNVYAQFVQFTEEFPVLTNDNGNQFKLDFKTEGYETWNTVYISGCENILKETQYDSKSHLVYLGQNSEPNITFLGFNLIHHYLITHNQDLKRFLDETLQLSSEDIALPIVVPVQIEAGPDKIVVNTQKDHVNTGIAVMETLEPNRIVSSQENLYLVNQGETVFRIVRAKQETGIVFSILGAVLVGLLWIMIYVLLEEEVQKKSS